jgi:hypothetical protein
VKLALDHHYTKIIAEQLRAKEHDVVAAVERGWEREDDEPLLALCESEQRTLVTNNVSDFTVIVQRWATQSRPHAGLVFTSDASLPRSRATIGTYVRLLDELMSKHPDTDSFVNHIHWL